MTVRTVTRSGRSSAVTAARTLICPGPWRIEFQCPLLAIRLHLFAVQRAKEEIHRSKTGVLNEKLVGLLKGLQAQQKRLTRLVLKSGGRIVFLRVEEIDWVEAADTRRLRMVPSTRLVRFRALFPRDSSIFTSVCQAPMKPRPSVDANDLPPDISEFGEQQENGF